MNAKDRMILAEFREQRPAFTALGDTVHNLLATLVKNAGIDLLSIEHRVKAEDSLKGKLERKGDRYRSLDDLTDILGARVICFFNDDVDAVGKLIASGNVPAHLQKYGTTVQEIFADLPDLRAIYGVEADNFAPGAIGVFSYLRKVNFGLQHFAALNRKFDLKLVDKTDLIPLTGAAKELL